MPAVRPTVYVRCEPAEHDRFKAKAEQAGMTLNEWALRACRTAAGEDHDERRPELGTLVTRRRKGALRDR
jgi:hypothetical protein